MAPPLRADADAARARDHDLREAGKKPNLGEAPSLVFKGLGLFVPIMRELAEMLYQWERPYRFSHAKFDKAFGKGDVLPHREAVRETVKWFREHPAPE